MDAATLQRIIEIVRNMNAQGLSKNEIIDNLRQMGIADEDIETIMKEAQPDITITDIHEKTELTKSMLEKGEHLKPAMEKLEEHTEEFERLHTTIGELHEKHEEVASKIDDLKTIRDDVEEVKKLLLEIKPLLASIERLNQNLLDINKKMLTKLGTK